MGERFHRPPVVSLQDVPATPWDEIVHEYDPADWRMDMRAMHALVERIAAAWWSQHLYAGSSHGVLYLAQTDPFDIYGPQRLIVEPHPMRGEITFRFGTWETSCPQDDAFAKLEHILRNRLKWIVGQPPNHADPR